MCFIKTWIELEYADSIQCPECYGVINKPKDENKLSISCPNCGSRLYNESKLFEQTYNYVESIRNSENIIYDENIEALSHFLQRFVHQQKVLNIVMPFLRNLSDKVLGKDWYIVDPVDGLTGLEIECDKIMETLFKEPESKKKTLFGRRRNK